MSCFRPRLSHLFVSAVMAVAAGVILAPPTGVAREGHRVNHETDIPVLSAPTRQGFDDIIVQMAPLRPAPGAVAAKAAPAPGVARETTPAPVVEASKDSAVPKDAAKTEPATPQTARMDGRPELRTGEPAMPAAAAVAQAAKAAAQPSTAVAQHDLSQGIKDLDLKIGEAAMPAKVATADQSAKRVEPVPAPSTPVERQTPATAVQTAKLPDLTVAEAAAPRQPAPFAAPSAAPSTPVAQPSPAPVAQAAKLPDLKIGEAAAPSTPIAQETPAPAAQAAKAPDLKTAAPPVAAQAANPAPAAAPPVAQVTVAQAPTNETLAYAALLAQGVRGPVDVRLADRATMWLPANRVYLDGEQARKLLGAGKNWDNATQGVVLPATSRPDWMAYVSLVDDGYVSDQDAKAMDPEAVLGTYKAKVAAENPARAGQGLSPLEVTGWMEAPRYDAKHRLSSCLGATVLGSKSADDWIVNCSSFALGDQGALKIVVAGQETNYQRFRGESGALIDTIIYDKGKGYDDADLATVKTAPYGLIALMTGDTNFKKVTVAQPAAPAPAQKLALIALLIVYAVKFGKILLFGVAAVFAFVRWMPRKRKSDDKKPAKAEVAAEPIWRRAIQAARARLGSRGEPAQPVAASAGAAEPELEEARPKTGVGAALAAARAKLPSLPLPRKGSEPAAASNAAPQGEESPAASLARLASMMRKKAPEVPVQVDLSRLERRPSFGAATAAAVKRSELEVVRPLPGAAPMAAPKPAAAALAPAPRAEPAPEPMPVPSPAPTLEPFALIEPGDEAAASIAISARESLREANG